MVVSVGDSTHSIIWCARGQDRDWPCKGERRQEVLTRRMVSGGEAGGVEKKSAVMFGTATSEADGGRCASVNCRAPAVGT